MSRQILIVDDVAVNRDMLQEMLEEEYEVLQAENGRQAVDLLLNFRERISAVLLDLIMPEMDGFEVLKVMQNENLIGTIPVMVISGDNSGEAEERCFEYGVSDFISKPFNEKVVTRRVRNIVSLFTYQNELEAQVSAQTELLSKQNRILKQQTEELKETNIRIIDILGNVVESRNLESGEHVKRVKGFARILGLEMMKQYPEYNLTPEKVETIAQASALHDIGKISIPDNVLLKPGRLTDEEFELMKTHTTKGCDIINNIEGIWKEDYRKVSYEICRYHHERFDGRGYPDHLKGEEIPVSAQIVSVGDVYDALVSERCYKSAFSKEEAFHMICDGKCGVFSPKLLVCFQNVRKEFEALADSNGNRKK